MLPELPVDAESPNFDDEVKQFMKNLKPYQLDTLVKKTETPKVSGIYRDTTIRRLCRNPMYRTRM